MATIDPDFPCSLVIHIPFPTRRLAEAALRSLAVDEELSPLVKRSFSLTTVNQDSAADAIKDLTISSSSGSSDSKQLDAATTSKSANSGTFGDFTDDESRRVLRVDYKASTNRMLRVAVNGFFESLGVIIQVMEELDTDVLHEKGLESLEGAQGIEQGMTGVAVAGV
ncbi:hypothetical protein BAUCODRAFT_146301 [Baudoinia panamericana UAMH 10762]|uniref:Pcc1-domain-containing protein n=1 Tax=Baudoinia panamericana (strain UAMH 10762) TaxID=717646 RepID=M2NJL9_BAUPA|nr:uncharacterized protein BAUCODRAFT_146301 [Baudoinia panamericana UAMH 10762]EMC99340.1 hypothetical protein BAUCODRAFT_146301 [Baudoinia panamericana UAMH 10762]